MANTAMLLIGGLGLAYLLGNKPTNQDDTGGDQVFGLGGVVGSGSALGDLVGADRNSSGVGAFNQREPTDQGEGLLSALTGMFSTLTAGFTGTTAGDAMELDVDSVVDETTLNIDPSPGAITGSLNPFFKVQGPTVSEISGNAVRQVGLLLPGEEVLTIKPALEAITISGESTAIGWTEPIEVLPANQAKPSVFTYNGGDGNEVVLNTSINRSAGSYFSTLETLKEARDYGLFDPVAAYVPQSVKAIESAYAASEEGIASRAVLQDAITKAYSDVAIIKSRELTETSTTWQDDASYRDPLSD
tara:strand:+ start:767 stop:1672 length:906 start_codon:yes stop_codon:yes gene_type:complete